MERRFRVEIIFVPREKYQYYYELIFSPEFFVQCFYKLNRNI